MSIKAQSRSPDPLTGVSASPVLPATALDGHATAVARPSAGRWSQLRRPGLVACGGLLLLCLASFATLLLPGPWPRAYLVEGDFSRQFYPFQVYAAQRLASGQLPLWDPYILGGQPHLADPQTALFYPVGLLVNLLGGRDGLSYEAMEWRAFVDVALGALFSYLFIARLSRSAVGGVVGAVTFAFGGYLASYPLPQLPVLEASIWLPLLLYGIERGLTEPRAWSAGTRWWLLAGLAGAILLLAGHGQTALLAGYAAAGYGLVRWIALRRPLLPTALQVLLALALAAALSAPQLLPTLSYLPDTNRVALGYSAAAGGFQWRDFQQLLLPGNFFLRSMYVGVLPLLLALVALRRSAAWGWAVLWSLAALLALGGHGPLYPLLYAHVPGFAAFRDQERAAYLVAFASAVLAGSGASAVLAWNRRRARPRSAGARAGLGQGAVLLLCLGLTLAGSALLRQGAPPAGAVAVAAPLPLNAAAALLLALPALLTLLAARRAWLRPALVTVLLCALPTLNLLGANGNLSRSSVNPLPPLPLQALAFLREQPGVWRVDTVRDHELPLNVGALVDLSFPRGDDPLVLRRSVDLTESGDHYKIWQLFNVGYLVAKEDPGKGFTPVFAADGFTIYRMQYGLPRVWAVRDVRLAPTPDAARSATLHLDQPGATVVLEQAPALAIVGPSLPGDQHVAWLERRPERLRWRETLTDNAILVMSEPLAPGWSATVDGRPVPLLRADDAFMAIALPAGVSTVALQYEPPGLRHGLALAAAAGTLALLLLVLSLAADRRRPPADAP